MNNFSIEQKYFPKEWDDLILPESYLKILDKKKESQGYRLLLHSTPGTGKTTTARLLTINDDVLYLSGSNNFLTKVMNEKVYPFATNFSLLNKQKTVIIDEFSGIKMQLQEAFKIILDQAVKVNFIFITNEFEKTNDAVLSRCTKLNYDFSGSDLKEQKTNYINYLINVCTQENIKYDKEGVRKLFQMNFPDFRNLLGHLDELKSKGKDVTLESVKTLSDYGKIDLQLYEMVMNPALIGKDFYQEIVKYKAHEKQGFLSLGEPFFEYLNNKKLYDKTLESAIIISKYSDSYGESINKFVTFFSCIVELKTLFR